MNNHEKSTDVDKTTKFFFYLCVTFCVSFFVWASIAPLDIVSDAIGEVVPSSKVKRIQHLEGGIVHEIKIREGDLVEIGQALIELEATASDSTVEELNVRVSSLKTQIARLNAESRWFNVNADDTSKPVKKGNDRSSFSASLFTIEPDFSQSLREESPGLVEQASELYKARRERFINDINSQKEKIKQREQDIQEITVRIRNQKQNLKYVQEQIKISEDLLKDKLTSRYKHLGFLKEESNLISKIEEDNAALTRSESTLSAAKEKLDQISNTFHEEVQEELRKSQRELLEFSQRLRKTADSLKRTVIRSPAHGIVKSIYVMGEGEVVQPGMTVLDIVPGGDKLVIEAHLALGDIGYVQVGQPATVKLATGDARMFGNLDGIVTRISPDAITTQEGDTYYRVMVETESDRFEKDGKKYQLYPGMRLLVGIKTGERTVMEYLLYPYFDTLYHGLQER
ncbi:HlyD family type I secretion periplasmic adaptor subunit [Pseudodesulfovibrio sp. zrk46]|uniref:HlyD family type I secretion periplasmic adaptor subunit n=1 Tax=Pseudodesulfovibrio sp. zrk46 TaxID=2725288 RepID=UPI001449E79B|nr:HlyD family type I secretion periplasmic adaptor subunit [Pseudodesulfovibrio sp. zrk46]QJB57641.1 HlyD family type I secretion periplasmic adaptor subunit [Pseudodesulfovibrio sp. zrk46]